MTRGQAQRICTRLESDHVALVKTLSFTLSDLINIVGCASLEEAKAYARDALRTFESQLLRRG